jgi:hypothetical protein
MSECYPLDHRIPVELVGGPACGTVHLMEPTAKALLVPVMLPETGLRRATYVWREGYPQDGTGILDFKGFGTVQFEQKGKE